MGEKMPRRKLSILTKGAVNPSISFDATGLDATGQSLELEGKVPGRRRSSTTSFLQFLHYLKDDGMVDGLESQVQPTGQPPPLQPSPDDSSPLPKEDGAEDGTQRGCRLTPRIWAYKNILGIGFSFLFVFMSFLGLQNLQSSINSAGGLGLTSLAVLYVFFVLFGFVSPSVINILGTKYSMVTGWFCFLLYTVSNFYPSWYTLIPTSVIVGMGSALLWAAASTHIVEVAAIVAPQLGVAKNHLIGTFTGLFFLFFQLAQIPGNLASSLILFPYNDLNGNVTDTNVNSDFCLQSAAAGQEFDLQHLYILCAVYTVCVCVGITFSISMVNHLTTDNPFFSSSRKFKLFVKAPLLDLLRVLKNYKMVLIAPISIYNGMEMSFAFGTFTALVANCFGTFQVGFTLIPLGISSAIMSAVYGKVIKYIPMVVIFFFGGVINMALLIFLLLWSPVPSYPAIFSFAVLWGAADGVWNTMTTSLTGILFPSQSDSAYSAQRIWLAVGFTIGFIAADVLDLNSQVWLMLVAIVLALCCTLAIKLLTQCNLKCYRTYKVSTGRDTSTSTNVKTTTEVQMK